MAKACDFDAVIVGAGFSGMYMLKTLRDQLGLKVRVIEAASSVGGTWYWNRYPGARCDTDAFIYCFTFDKELLREWEWSERYPAQPEILRYLEHVAAPKDPVVAEKLIPKGYPFGTKRNPLDSGYFETFNRDNVLLVDAATDGPIEEMTEKGIRAGGKEYEFDIIVFATGFDALTGSFQALNLKGRGGRTLQELWANGPRSYLGLMANGFPNFFTITGPQSPSVLANMPVAIEQHVEWLTSLIAHLQKEGKTMIEPTLDAQDKWVTHVNAIVNTTLMVKANSWYMSANIADKPKAFLPYLDPEGVGGYRKRCEEIAAKGYEGFQLA